MSSVIWVNDHDLEADLGLTSVSVTGLEGWSASTSYAREVSPFPDSFAPAVGLYASPSPRTVRISAILNSATVAARDLELAKLLDVFSGLVELRFGDASDKVLEGYVASEASSSLFERGGMALAALAVSMDVLCPNPTKRDRYVRSVAFGATRAAIELGTAPGDGIIRIMGAATNPVLTYRDAGGNTIATMTFTVTLGATEYLEIDTANMTVSKYTAGVKSGALSTWTAGNFFRLDPGHGSYEFSSWPTIAVSAGSGVVTYHKRWRN